MAEVSALDVFRKLRELRQGISSMEGTCLKLLRHPDTQPEHLVQAHKMLQEVIALYEEAYEKVRAKYGRHPAFQFWDKHF